MCKTIQDYAVPFAAWDVRLYLNTHPTDRCALAAYRRLCAQCAGTGSYACLPDSEYTDDRWCWIDGPWPWECAANCPCACGAQTRANPGSCQCSQCQRRV